mgnify:CR=1 FL=1
MIGPLHEVPRQLDGLAFGCNRCLCFGTRLTCEVADALRPHGGAQRLVPQLIIAYSAATPGIRGMERAP